ncbi:hypothetical protein TWF696_004605 [Orbilia brochopaga]|uniref:Uncharacterized protein n=1 Tax=Orbilia brochopaga TaxID=3140254 RepID=A0AAV9V6S0_9PEZI
MRFTSMQRTDMFRTYLLTILISFIEQSHAFYRLWGYTDLQGNPPSTASLRAQAISLNRSSRPDLKALCHSFPDPVTTELNILRVAAFMNHGSNPLQAIGFWQEPDFNCGKAAPELVIYLKPGPEVQSIDLRAFGGEAVYTNWKQLLPFTAEWIKYVAPELLGDKKRGEGFVKRLARNAVDHRVVENTNTVWDTQAPKTAWETDRRPEKLAREAAKNFFENFFKTEMKWINDNSGTAPLSQEAQQRLQEDLDGLRQALQYRLQLWAAKHGRPSQPVNRNVQSQNPWSIQTSNAGLGTLPQVQPYQAPFWPYFQGAVGENPNAGLAFGNINIGNGGDDIIEVKKAEDIPEIKNDIDSSIEEIVKEEFIPQAKEEQAKEEQAKEEQTKQEAEDAILGEPEPGEMPLTVQDPFFGNARQNFQPLILTPPPTGGMMNLQPGRLNVYNPSQNIVPAPIPDQQFERLTRLQPIVPADWYLRNRVNSPFGNLGTNARLNSLQRGTPYYGLPVNIPALDTTNIPSLNTKRPLQEISNRVFEREEEEAIIDSRKRYFTDNDRNNPIVIPTTPEEQEQETIRPNVPDVGQLYIQDLLRRIQDVDTRRAERTALRRELNGLRPTNPGVGPRRRRGRPADLTGILESFRTDLLPIPADGESPDIPFLRDPSDEQGSVE